MRVASTTSTWPWAIVEIARGSDERELTELIRAAYRSSRSGLVALALRGVTREIADRALDPIVDTLSDDARGVVYMDADETREDVYTAASHASVVVASTEDFRIELLKRGISVVGVEDVARGLLARPEAH
jgi:hypothetical protein